MNEKNKQNNFLWQKKTNNSRYITNSSCGLLFTIDGDDKRGLREALNIIDSYIPCADISESVNIGEENQLQTIIDEKSFPAKFEDVSDVLSKMCAYTARNGNRYNKGNNKSGLHQLDTGVKHTLFFTFPNHFTPESIYDIAARIATDCQKNQRCRFLAKILPIEDTCVGDLDSLPERILRLVQKHFQAFDSVKAPTYAVEFKARNSDLLTRKTIIDLVTDAVESLSPSSRVNLSSPDLLVFVNVMRKAIMFSCIRNYYLQNRLAVRPFVNKNGNNAKLALNDEAPNTNLISGLAKPNAQPS